MSGEEPADAASGDAGQAQPVRSLMRRWRAILLLAAGAMLLSLVLWAMHG